ncbi:MAG: manganese catalase family protein [Bacilli bacterium]|nr:manganese catalase family protein [Bacilli bacterium]
MWKYEKKLQYPVNIRKKDLKLAKYILTQYGGPAGELAAAWQYLNQRYIMPDERGKALLTDIGTEELAHVEIISTMLYQLMQGATVEELKAAGLAEHYAQYGKDLFPADAFGNPFTMTYIKASGDYIADIESNMGAEQRARATYEHLMDLTNDPDVLGPLSFLRQREIIHYQRFKELRNYYLKNKTASTKAID